MIAEQACLPGPHDRSVRCSCGVFVWNPLLEPRQVIYERQSGMRHICPRVVALETIARATDQLERDQRRHEAFLR